MAAALRGLRTIGRTWVHGFELVVFEIQRGRSNPFGHQLAEATTYFITPKRSEMSAST
jgi:hypothetical protein